MSASSMLLTVQCKGIVQNHMGSKAAHAGADQRDEDSGTTLDYSVGLRR